MAAHPRLPEGVPIRFLTVTYGKRREIGRRIASHPSSQHCPSSLRAALVKRFYHDIDMVNCHPVLFLQVAIKMGVSVCDLEPLQDYVDNRDAFLARVGSFYGVDAKKCKYAVLRVLNGGSMLAWAGDAQATRNKLSDQPDLSNLAETQRIVQGAFFQMEEFSSIAATLKNNLRASTAANMASANVRSANARTPQEKLDADKNQRTAQMKSTWKAIDRSVFSLCVFQLEDCILDVIDAHLRSRGWTVASLQFDGMHVEHRTDHSIVDAMRGAETAVKEKLSYEIRLVEKALFETEPQANGDNNSVWYEDGEYDGDNAAL
jgi:hypothetical protein